jgi:hypothetical protein
MLLGRERQPPGGIILIELPEHILRQAQPAYVPAVLYGNFRGVIVEILIIGFKKAIA